MNRPRIVVVGSANTDFVIQVAELPGRGETVLGGDYITAGGGKGANQAVAAARLGAQVWLVARLGTDSLGQESLKSYQQEGVVTDYIIQDAHTPSGVALILVNQKGENMIAVAPGANHSLSPADIAAAEPAIRNANCLLLQLEIPLETAKAAIDLASVHHIPVILNPAPAMSVPLEMLRMVTVLTPNEVELKTLCGQAAPTGLEEQAAWLYQLSGVRELVVTLGPQGALVVSGGGVRHFPALPVQPVDTTGCGDAFNAALAVMLGQGSSLEQAVLFANGAGALAATRWGAQPSLPRLEELESFLHLDGR